MAFMKSRMVQVNPQVYATLQAHISEHISLKANQEVVEAMAQDPQLVQMSEQDPEMWTVQFNAMVAKRVGELTNTLVQAEAGGQQQDPLVALKSRELDLKAMDLQRKSQEFETEEQRKQNEIMIDTSIEQAKIDQARLGQQERIRVAEEKLDIARMKEMQRRN